MKRILTIIAFMAGTICLKAQYVRPAGDNSASSSTTPQQSQPYNFWSHVSIGGSLGLQFGNVTFVGISPLLNYHINDYVEIGAGPIYQYFSYNDPYYNYSYSTSIYGGRITALCFLPGQLSHIFIMGEYDIINVPDYYSPIAAITRATIEIPLVGVGVRRPIGEHSYLIVSGLWDLSNSVLSPYQNPIITAGIDVGI